jgi:hypothetical protein
MSLSGISYDKGDGCRRANWPERDIEREIEREGGILLGLPVTIGIFVPFCVIVVFNLAMTGPSKSVIAFVHPRKCLVLLRAECIVGKYRLLT